MNIVTITLSPAFDIHCYTAQFAPYHENLVHVTARSAGGKGVNISRALASCGVESTALVVLGEENAADFRRALIAPLLQVKEICVKGRIRENVTLHTEGAPETRLSFTGFAATDALLDAVKDALADTVDGETVLTFTGRVPEGVSLAAVKKLLLELQGKGARLVIDSKSFTLDDLIACRPFLIKPNEEEIVAYAGGEVADLSAAVTAATALRAHGIENVMISLGEKGAVLASPDGCFAADAPRVAVHSTIGAGDSTTGGFLAAMKDGGTYAEMLRTAVCYGSAACMTEGTEPPRKADVDALLREVQVKRI